MISQKRTDQEGSVEIFLPRLLLNNFYSIYADRTMTPHLWDTSLTKVKELTRRLLIDLEPKGSCNRAAKPASSRESQLFSRFPFYARQLCSYLPTILLFTQTNNFGMKKFPKRRFIIKKKLIAPHLAISTHPYHHRRYVERENTARVCFGNYIIQKIQYKPWYKYVSVSKQI